MVHRSLWAWIATRLDAAMRHCCSLGSGSAATSSKWQWHHQWVMAMGGGGWMAGLPQLLRPALLLADRALHAEVPHV